MLKRLILLLLGTLLYLPQLHSDFGSCLSRLFLNGVHEVGIGPEWYYIRRIRCSGSHIEGNLGGGVVEYDRFRRTSLYWGLFNELMFGDLNGRSGSGVHVHADAKDWRIEGRLGWTFHICCYSNPFLTLYTGYGHFEERLAFELGCNNLYTSEIFFNYIPLGFYVRCYFTCAFWISLRAQVMWPFNPKNRITNDPVNGDATLLVGPHFQSVIELPLEWRCRYGVRVVPFYYSRKYDGRENFPGNFIETRAHIGGCRLEVTTSF